MSVVLWLAALDLVAERVLLRHGQGHVVVDQLSEGDQQERDVDVALGDVVMHDE